MAAVSLPGLLIFTNQFSAMMGSQLPLLSVLQNLGRETPQRRFREVIEDICDDVEQGFDLGDAMAEHPDVFDDIYVNVVRAGIGSGRLDDALQHLSAYLTSADEVKRKVKSATSYPLFMLVAFFAAFNGMVFFILPRFEQMFASFGKDLPWLTQLMMDIGAFWQAYWYLVLIGIVGIIASIIAWLASAEGRLIWDEYKIKIPIIGPMWRMAALSRFLRTFAVQVKNDVEILRALTLAAPASGNTYVEHTILMIADDVENGISVSDSFRAHDVFSGIVLQMIASGEEAGTLDDLLLSAADYFDRLLENQIQSWTALINPILTVTIGLGIAGMMVAVFLPVFDLGATQR